MIPQQRSRVERWRLWGWGLVPLVVALCPVTAACGDGDSSGIADIENGEWLPGGAATNRLLGGIHALSAPAPNITAEHEASFFAGNSLFNQGWVEAPSSTEIRDGLGPLFNARSCSACHFRDGRGRPPLEPGESFVGLLLRLSVAGTAENGAPVPEPTYGAQLQPFSIPGVAAEGSPRVTYRELGGAYADGEDYTLLVPEYHIDDLGYGGLAADARLSPRVAQAVSGVGLLEAIPPERLEALADPDDRDGDGISGRPNLVWNVRTASLALGRFGWKSEQPTLEQQATAAFLGDIGITNPIFEVAECTKAQGSCSEAMSGGSPEISASLLAKVTLYTQLLAVPKRDTVDTFEIRRGKWLFTEAGCAACHVPRHETGNADGLPELSHQVIFPYTDLLLHDMGEGLSDHRASHSASGAEWRTPPLWALRYYKVVGGHDRLLHDGRARGIAEAILWHGGEGEAAREAFRTLDAADRAALSEFLGSL